MSISTNRREIYISVANLEHIFHLETLAGSLACSDPEKKWFLLLTKLARQSLIIVKRPIVRMCIDPDQIQVEESLNLYLRPFFEKALYLRQRLTRVLKIYR